MAFRKPIAIAVSAIAGVFGVYWQEILPVSDALKQIPNFYLWMKYGMPAMAFGWAFWVTAEFYKD